MSIQPLGPSDGRHTPIHAELRVVRQAAVQLARVRAETGVRLATAHGEGLVSEQKLREIDNLVREAMTGQAMLQQWAQVLSVGDPFLADDLKFFRDVAKIGKGEVIADAINTFGRESRR